MYQKPFEFLFYSSGIIFFNYRKHINLSTFINQLIQIPHLKGIFFNAK